MNRSSSPGPFHDIRALAQDASVALSSLLHLDSPDISHFGVEDSDAFIVDSDTAKLLAVIILPSCDHDDALLRRPWSKIKMSLPLLRHDHELCMSQLYARNDTSATLAALTYNPKLHDLDYAWTDEELKCTQRIQQALSGERLELHPDTIAFLADLLVPSEKFTLASPERVSRTLLESMELDMVFLPMAYDSEAKLISSDASDLATLSIYDFDADTATVERIDDLLNEPLNSLDSNAPVESSSAMPPALPNTSWQALKVATPVLPLSSESTAFVSSASGLHVVADMVSSSTFSDPEHAVAEAVQLAQPAFIQVEGRLRCDKLVELDTTLRMQAPALRIEAMCQLWSDYCASQLAALSQHLADETFTRWSGVSRLERSLPWMPFDPILGHVDCVEQLDASNVDVSLLTDLSTHEEAPEGVRLSRLVIDDALFNMQVSPYRYSEVKTVCPSGVLDPSPSETHTSQSTAHVEINAGVRNRDVEEPIIWPAKRRATDVMLSRLVCKRLRVQEPPHHETSTQVVRTDLSSFLKLNNVAAPSICSQMPVQYPELELDVIDNSAQEPPALAAHAELSTPVLTDVRRQLVLTSQALTRHVLIRELERRLPQLVLVERGMMTAGGMALHEADITINPSLGVILTTIQKLKQRPLPGSAVDDTIRMRLTKLASRYEKLILLITQGSNRALECSLLQDECEVLAETTIWADMVDTQLMIHYVPGGETNLAAAICLLVITYGGNETFDLCIDESRHERLLRTMGLNAFAAQSLLSVSAAQASGDKLSLTFPSAEMTDTASSDVSSGIICRLHEVIHQEWFQSQ